MHSLTDIFPPFLPLTIKSFRRPQSPNPCQPILTILSQPFYTNIPSILPHNPCIPTTHPFHLLSHQVIPKTPVKDLDLRGQLTSNTFIYLTVFFVVMSFWANFMVGTLHMQLGDSKLLPLTADEQHLYGRYFSLMMTTGALTLTPNLTQPATHSLTTLTHDTLSTTPSHPLPPFLINPLSDIAVCCRQVHWPSL